MKLSAFRIENYRSIHDSGWIEVDDISVIVGKNESGKTSLLKALWKFKPFHESNYKIDREWPRGRRKEKSLLKIVASLRFSFTPEEISDLERIHESAKGITAVEITRNYKGTYIYSFLPTNPSREHDLEWVVSFLNNRLGEAKGTFSDQFKKAYTAAFQLLINEVREKGGTERAKAKLPEFKNQFPSFVSNQHPLNQQDRNAIPELNEAIDAVVSELAKTPFRQVIDHVHERLPTFIYMDDFRIYQGSAQLDEVKQRKDRGSLTKEDETLITIMEMAGLDLDDEVAKGNGEDKEQRMLDLNDASLSLTQEIADRWSQKKYEVRFEADGQHFITFVKDVGATALVPLEERSKGFQWFFSFDMMFMYETKGKFANAIILLDEPGLHLHAAAQRDLLIRMAAYAENNQLIYSTHLPFMIDFTRLDNIYVAEDLPKEGTKVHKNWARADKDARFTLQAALGLSWSQSLFVGQYNLVVEGVTDFWYLTTISTLLREAGKDGLDEELVVTPVGGASKAVYVGTILHGQKLKVAVLLDSDQEGKTAYEQLVHEWIMEAKNVLMIADILGVKEQRTLEDLFEEKYYLAHVQAAYNKELGATPLAVAQDKRGILERIAEAFKARGVEKFNKGRVAKRIMEDLGKRTLPELKTETVKNFQTIITAVNEHVAAWRKTHKHA